MTATAGMTTTRRILRCTLACALALPGAGCGYLFGDQGVFRDKSEDYRRAPELPALRVPEGKDAETFREIYPIPPIEETLLLTGKFEVPRPAPLVTGGGDDLVRIQKLGEESWVLVSEAPGQVWPQVRGFLAATGIPVNRVDASGGLMETSWLELQGQTIPSRFRYRIEQGVQRGTSELHVLQMHQAGDAQRWPERSDDLALEGEMLRALAQYIANGAENVPVSMVAEQSISATGRISLQEAPDGHTYIRLSLPYDRAWASVGRALENSRFEITDRDRSAGRYYARFLGAPDEDEDGGWFDWLFGSDEDPLSDEIFVVSVESLDAQTVAVRLRPQEDGDRIDRGEEQSLLALLKGNIN
jgi:outer membrane protein assembly factor BamC